VNRLIAAGIIRGFSAIVDPGALGFGLQAFVDVKLQHGVSMETFAKAIRGVKGVREATVLTGAFDALKPAADIHATTVLILFGFGRPVPSDPQHWCLGRAL